MPLNPLLWNPTLHTSRVEVQSRPFLSLEIDRWKQACKACVAWEPDILKTSLHPQSRAWGMETHTHAPPCRVPILCQGLIPDALQTFSLPWPNPQ